MRYEIRKSSVDVASNLDWNDPVWKKAMTVKLERIRPESSDCCPDTEVRMLYTEKGIHVIFRVEDCCVRSVHVGFQVSVCKDSCVEFFVKPKRDKGYFNFETNAGGSLLCNYIEDHRRTKEGFEKFQKLRPEQGAQVKVLHSMPETVDPEITEPTVWFNQIFIPFSVLEQYVDGIGNPAGQTWTCNFFKCGDETSHPHWISWSPVNELNFHLPDCFGELYFAG